MDIPQLKGFLNTLLIFSNSTRLFFMIDFRYGRTEICGVSVQVSVIRFQKAYRCCIIFARPFSFIYSQCYISIPPKKSEDHQGFLMFSRDIEMKH